MALSRVRLAILVFGPAPIVAASLAVTHWVRSDASPPLSPNTVHRTSRDVAYGDAGSPTPATASSKPVKKTAATSPLASTTKASRVQPTVAVAPLSKLDKACSQTASRLEKQLGRQCHVIVRSPFVIGGDMEDVELEEWHNDTIGPAAKAMANCYFRVAPSQPITVLLFNGEQSYNYFADKLFNEAGISIYGYYKPNLRTLVMNISTGGGTLVHELTHALMDFDFPKVPDWFNEGLASLHEQCNFQQDQSGLWIEGQINWRLPGLQEAIRRERLRSLKSLVEENDFRGKFEGTNYAQARYFCLYMQEKGVLRDYFRTFRDGAKDDPRGVHAVTSVFPNKSWDELDRDFQDWVMTLKR